MELKNPMISLARQCDLLGMNRSSFYYRSRRNDGYNDFLMRLIDEQYTQRPTSRVEKMRDWLRNQGHWVNEKRVRRSCGSWAFMPSIPNPGPVDPVLNIRSIPIYSKELRWIILIRLGALT